MPDSLDSTSVRPDRYRRLRRDKTPLMPRRPLALVSATERRRRREEELTGAARLAGDKIADAERVYWSGLRTDARRENLIAVRASVRLKARLSAAQADERKGFDDRA